MAGGGSTGTPKHPEHRQNGNGEAAKGLASFWTPVMKPIGEALPTELLKVGTPPGRVSR